MRNRAVKHNVTTLRFQTFPLLYTGGEAQAEASITSYSASLISSC